MSDSEEETVRKARGFVATVWLAHDEETDERVSESLLVHDWAPPPAVEHCIIAWEEADEEDNVPHLHLGVYFSNPRSATRENRCAVFREVWPWFPDWAHTEVASNYASYRRYCMKDGDCREWGSPPAQGKRTDFEDKWLEIRKFKMTERQISELWPSFWARNYRAIQRYLQLHFTASHTRIRKNTLWLYGTAGCGKTYRATAWMEKQGFQWALLTVGKECWFDGWEPDMKGLVLDEFDGTMPLSFLLRLLDENPMQVPIKGGFVPFLATTVIITSNLPPWQLYEMGELARHDYGRALRRRLTKVVRGADRDTFLEETWPE